MTEHDKLTAIILPVLLDGNPTDSVMERWASDMADAIIDSGQWVPRSALTAASARLDAVLAYADSIDHPNHGENAERERVCDTCRLRNPFRGGAYWPCVYRRHAEEIRAAVTGGDS